MNQEKEFNCNINQNESVAQYDAPQAIVPLEFKNKVVNYFSVTQKALDRIKFLISKREKKSSGIKITLRAKGCSGMAYKIEFADYGVNLTDFDEMLVIDDIRIFIDIKASLFVIGMEMDYAIEETKEGFVFINPNEKGRCGCGSSFYV